MNQKCGPDPLTPLTIPQALALALREQRAGRLDAAQTIYQKILAVEPAHPVALHSLGVIAYSRKDYQAASDWVRRAIEADPGVAGYHNTLGACRRGMGRPEEALASYARALALDPDHADARANLGNALTDLGRYEEAIASYERALALKADGSTHLSLGNSLVAAGRPERALAHYRNALTLRPDDATAHFAYALALLMCGDLAEGWREYQWRHESHARRMGVYRDFPQPPWDGADLQGRRLLLYGEQGYGDALQFIRYAPLAARRGGRVIVECRPELARLFGRVAGVAAVVARGEPLPEFDTQRALLSLPLVFQTTLDSIPAEAPYIAAERDAAAAWRERLSRDAGVKVGIVWSGSPTNKLNARKACPLDRCAPLAGIAGARYYSLQKGPAAAQANAPAAGIALTDWSAELRDFADTAALVANLDLVVSVDTAVAHLAGAMGKPVWLLLSSEGDWRWLLEREDSPWYPTLRIFRQQRPGDWAGVIGRVAAALREFVDGGARRAGNQ